MQAHEIKEAVMGEFPVADRLPEQPEISYCPNREPPPELLHKEKAESVKTALRLRFIRVIRTTAS